MFRCGQADRFYLMEEGFHDQAFASIPRCDGDSACHDHVRAPSVGSGYVKIFTRQVPFPGYKLPLAVLHYKR